MANQAETLRGGAAAPSPLTVKAESISAQLIELSSSLSSVVESKTSKIQFESMVVKLTLTAEGKVAFIAKGSVEASIELTFSRPDAT